MELEIRPVRRRIDRIDTQLRPDMSEALDDLISASFIDSNERGVASARRSLQRINQEVGSAAAFSSRFLDTFWCLVLPRTKSVYSTQWLFKYRQM